jgi:hypothetical protein
MKVNVPRRHWSITTLIIVAGFALSGSQCARVSDQLTGPQISSEPLAGGVSDCVQACNQIAQNDRNVEKDLHKTNLTACQQLRGAAKDACMSEENARHDARTEEIDAQLDYCKSLCHEQGSGTGGQ